MVDVEVVESVVNDEVGLYLVGPSRAWSMTAYLSRDEARALWESLGAVLQSSEASA